MKTQAKTYAIKARRYIGQLDERRALFVDIKYSMEPAERCTDGSLVTWGTTDHGPRVSARRELSICGDVVGPLGSEGGGQNLDDLRALIDSGSGLAIYAADAGRLLEIWEKWHLNGMNPGCDHQKTGHYSDPKISGQVCPHSGYKYGTAWLFKAVPADVVEWLSDFCAKPNAEVPRSFVARALIEAEAKEAFSNPNMKDAREGDRHWSVRLIRRERAPSGLPVAYGKPAAVMVVPFTQGSAYRKPPTAQEVISCLVMDAASADASRSFEGWAGYLGFDPDSREAKRTYKAAQKQAASLRAFLGEELYREAMEG